MSDVDEVKSRLSIADIIGVRVALKKAGRNFKGLCPFHNEKTPSFMVSPERQTFHCFGCGKGGSVIDFVMEYEHVDFVEALEQLAEKAGVKLERRQGETPEGKLKQKILEVNHLASEFYHYLLTKHTLGENARLYLKNRGVSDASVKTFVLGYSPNSWDGLLKFLKKKGYEEELLIKAGLTIESRQARNDVRRSYDRFRGRVMFTLKDHRGNVVGFSGRVLDPTAKEAKYINTSETPVYIKSNVLYGLDVTKDAIAKANEAIVMEGELDVISSFQAGISNAVAIKGSALTEGHVHLLKRFAERILFALDSDMAGDAASRRGIEIADREGLDMKVVIIPMGKDPDEAARENPGLLKKAIKEAIPVYDYFISSALARFDGRSAFGKKKIADELLPIVSAIENPIVQSHYVKKLAGVLSVSEETVQQELRRVKKNLQHAFAAKDSVNETPFAKTRAEKLELYLLALLLQGKTADLFEELVEEIQPADFLNPAISHILTKLGEFLSTHPVFLMKDFADSLPSELLPTLDEAFLWDMSAIIDDEEKCAKEWTKTLFDLRRENLKQAIQELSRSLQKGGTKTDEERTKAHEKLKELTDRLNALEKRSGT